MRVEIRYEVDTHDLAPGDLRALLGDDLLLANLEQVIERVQHDLDGLVCRVHQQPPFVTVTVLAPGDLAVDLAGCCEGVVRAAKMRFNRGLVQTAYFQPGMKLLVHVEDTPDPLVFDFSTIDTLVIGRSVPGSDDVPDIDLEAYDAFERGISRRHAVLFWRNGTLHIADEGSANGTFLNGKRLPPNQPSIIRNNDRITLGGLVLEVELVY